MCNCGPCEITLSPVMFIPKNHTIQLQYKLVKGKFLTNKQTKTKICHSVLNRFLTITVLLSCISSALGPRLDICGREQLVESTGAMQPEKRDL